MQIIILTIVSRCITIGFFGLNGALLQYAQGHVVSVFKKEVEFAMTSNLIIVLYNIKFFSKIFFLSRYHLNTKISEYYCGGNNYDYKTCNMQVNKFFYLEL